MYHQFLIEQSWKEVLSNEFKSPYFTKLKEFLLKEKSENKIFPSEKFIFEAFNKTPFDKVKVIIIGQDPYHGFGQADGLCFSVNAGIKIPPSLKNIFKELNSNLSIRTPKTGKLESWAKQGVLLLNATLTVRENQAGSHQKKGWETFTDAAVRELSDRKNGLVFLLWGKYAQSKESLIDKDKHNLLEAAHPSPLSAYKGFFGCQHFSKTNEILSKQGLQQINWQNN